MKRDDLDRSFGATPKVFTDHIDETLRALEEEKPVKKFTYRTVLVAAMITLLLCGIAYAAITQGQQWYYDNIYTALEEHQPEVYKAIIDNLTTDVPQEIKADASGLISAAVQDYSWAREQNVFTMSLAARPVDDKKYELYSIWNIDTDGANVGEIDPEDPESRLDHWLWTKKGFGLPKDVMNDPSKQLLLVNFVDELFIGDTKITIPGQSFDSFIGDDGAAVFVYQYDLNKVAPEAVKQQYANVAVRPSQPDESEFVTVRPGDKGLAVQRIQQRLSDLGYYNGYVNGESYDDEVTNCLATFQKKNGLVADGIAGVETQKKLFADDAMPVMEDWEMPAAYYGPSQEWIDQMIADAQNAKEAIEKNTDANGILTLRMNYLVYPFADGEIGQPTEGTATFKVKIK